MTNMPHEELMQMRDALGAPIPAESVKSRTVGGGRQVDYVPGDVVIARLNATALEWSLRVTDRWMQTLDVNRWDDQARKSEMVERECLVLMGEMTIPGLGTRSGMGVQVLEPAAGEDPLKGALTDLEKNCAKKFGVGLELYGSARSGGQATTKQPTNGTNAPAQGNSGPMQPTEAQSGLIERRARELGLSADQLDVVCREATRYPLNNIGKKSASALIERLNAMKEEREQGGNPPSAGPTTPPNPGTGGTGATADDMTVKRWLKTIEGAKSTAQLDAMQATLGETGLASNPKIAKALNDAENALNEGAAEGKPF